MLPVESTGFMGDPNVGLPMWPFVIGVYLALGVLTLWISWKRNMAWESPLGSRDTAEYQRRSAIPQILFFPFWWFGLLLSAPTQVMDFLNDVLFINTIINSTKGDRND